MGSLLSRSIAIVASVTLFLMMLISVVDVAGRNIFGAPLPGGSELIELAMVITVFLLYPRVAYRGLHISVDILDPLTNDFVKRIQAVVAEILGAAVFGAIAYRLWLLGDRTAGYGDITASLEVPMSIIYWFMAFLSGVTAMAFLARIPRAVRGHDPLQPSSGPEHV